MKKTILLLCLITLLPIRGICNENVTSVSKESDSHIETSTDPYTDDEGSVVFRDGVAYDFGFSWKIKKSGYNKRLEPHWSGFSFTFANFKNLDSPSLDFQSSYSINWNLMSASTTIHNHWLLLTGLGIDWSRYHFKGDYGLQEIKGITEFVPAEGGITYRDSKLLAYHFTVPFLVEYQLKPFFINAGPIVYINCYSKSQVEERYERGGLSKLRLGKGLNILPVNVRLMAQIGMGDFGLVGYYSPFSMFANNKGPEIYPWGAGIKINF
jgi:hypothetical protein